MESMEDMDVMDVVFESAVESLPLLRRGKVRDVYALDERHVLIIATDRLSAFDVVLPDAIPGKGRVLTALSDFWFRRTAGVIANHATGLDPRRAAPELRANEELRARAMIARKARPLPIEAIVRGYLLGSGWRDYRETGRLGGIALPAGLPVAARLPQPLFTPSTKAAAGDHDVNISFAEAAAMVGRDVARRVRTAALAVYRECAAYALTRGIIIADTKFEFGFDDDGRLLLIDEIATPDSSRFWDARAYRAGENPPNFDKQFVRDYLERTGWDKTAPAPRLPADIIRKTAHRYRRARDLLIGT